MRYLRIITIFIFILACAVFGWTAHDISKRDTIPPVITDTVGELHLKVSDDDSMLKAGLTATDDRDGNLTDKILIERVSRFSKPGNCQVDYVVFDNNNNFCRYQRTVIYDDYTSPKLQLVEPLMYQSGEKISIIERIKLFDCLDGDITHKLKLESSNVPDDTIGSYEIELRATNNYGDEIYAKIPLNIGVYSSDAPKIELEQFLVYTKIGEKFEPLDYVKSVVDRENNSIPFNEIKILSQVDLTKVGGGQVCFEVADNRGVVGVTYLTVIVEEAE